MRWKIAHNAVLHLNQEHTTKHCVMNVHAAKSLCNRKSFLKMKKMNYE